MGGSGVVPTKRKPLGRLIGTFKTVSTKRVNDIRTTPGAKLWQRNYYEHAVRDNVSLRHIREYIARNPSRWDLDREKQTPEGSFSELPARVDARQERRNAGLKACP